MELALVLTSRCNAACTHCSTSCGPTRSETLSAKDITSLMDQAAGLDDGEPLIFHITGGEPFLSFEKLVATVKYGSELGATVTCTTNAYWATSPDTARDKLRKLSDNGLSVLGISVSRFHQKFVPIKRVHTALSVAAELTMETLLKGAVTRADMAPGGHLENWKSQLSPDRVHIFPVLPYLREDASLADDDYYREPGLPDLPCPASMVCVEPDGTAVSCCSPGGPTPFLSLGSTHLLSLKELQQRLDRLSKQRILREQGPRAFAEAAIAAGEGRRLRSGYAGPCDLCLHIARDAELGRIADDLSDAMDKALIEQVDRDWGRALP